MATGSTPGPDDTSHHRSTPPGWGWGYPPPPNYQHPQQPYPPYQYYPQPGLIPLRPLNVGDIIRASFSAIRRYPAAILGTNALIVLGGLILLGVYAATAMAVAGPTLRHVAHALNQQEHPSAHQAAVFGAVLGGGAIVMALANLVLMISSQIVSSTAAGRGAIGRAFGFAEAWSEIRHHIWRVTRLYLTVAFTLYLGFGVVTLLPGALLALATGSGAYFAVGLLIGLLTVPALIFFQIRYDLAGPTLVLERGTVRDALRRSWRLVGGSWWRVLGIVLLMGLLTAVLVQFLQLPIGIVSTLIGLAVSGAGPHLTVFGLVVEYLVLGLGTAVLTVLQQPLRQLPAAFLYIDLRIRRESLDTALAAEAGLSWPAPDPATRIPEPRVSPQPEPAPQEQSESPRDSESDQAPPTES